jgi:hypothetical protein
LVPDPTTVRQTRQPTRSPTLNPSPLPTNLPTLRPTVTKTLLPPLIHDSEAPSPAIIGQSDPSPTASPLTSSPTSTPMSLTGLTPPSEAPSPSYKYKKTILRVRDVSFIAKRNPIRIVQSDDIEIYSNCTEIWQASIQERIASEVVAVHQPYETVNVELLDVLNRANATALSLTFDVRIEIRSPSTDGLDAARLIVGPFDSQSERSSFVNYLKSTGCTEFEDIVTISVFVPNTIKEQSPNDSGTSLVALYAGLAVAGAAFIMMGTTILCYVQFRKRRRIIDDNSLSHVTMDNDNGRMVPTPLVIGGKSKNSDVSTLGDPIPFGVTKDQNEGDLSTNESISLEYDFKKAYLDVHSETDSHLGVSIDELTMEGVLEDQMMLSLADDIVTTGGDTGSSPQFESDELFDVVVPPGVLGLILESNDEDVEPTVYNIKPNSVLASIVKVGDRLRAVDGQCVATMKAYEASRIIALQQDQFRTLVFARRSKRNSYQV